MSSIVIPFIGGLAMFIYGMNIMADGLQHAAGSKMKKILEVLTQNKLMGIALGALVTAIIQSSSATTVMVVGFVNAGLMNLTQAISVIMGANIGTTITGWLVSAGEWAKMFSPSTLAPIAVMVGVIVTLVGKRQQSKDVAGIIIGFGILFIGMNTMSDAVYPLRESEVFKTAFVSMGSNPFLGILVGAGVTAIIQSSSASQGILLSLASAGLVPTNAAVFIIMGQNIGTCVTAILSSVGASKNAKCVGTMHLTFNIAGTIIFSILAMFLFARLDPSYGEGIINMTQISFIHTVFNVGTTIILMPFSGYIIKFAMKVNGLKAVETKSDEAELVHLDKRMMSTPSVAVEGAKLETIRMGRIARENLSLALSTLSDHDEEKMADVKQREFVIDKLCDNISKYLIDLCMLHLSDKDNEMVTSLLNTVSDMERVGDHAENIVELAEEMKQEGISFSDTALEELNEMSTTTLGAYDNAVKALELDDITYAVKTSFLEDQVDAMEKKLRAGHIERLSNAECSVNAGIHFIDLLGNLERVSDHAMNIAQVVLNEHRAEKNFHEEKNVE
jgi:phosphate:Na+ symporter